MSQSATMQYLCAECDQTTTFQRGIELGNNIVDVTCSYCGERWHINFQVLSIEPLLIGDWLIKRYIGTIRDNTFFGKEQLN